MLETLRLEMRPGGDTSKGKLYSFTMLITEFYELSLVYKIGIFLVQLFYSIGTGTVLNTYRSDTNY